MEKKEGNEDDRDWRRKKAMKERDWRRKKEMKKKEIEEGNEEDRDWRRKKVPVMKKVEAGEGRR